MKKIIFLASISLGLLLAGALFAGGGDQDTRSYINPVKSYTGVCRFSEGIPHYNLIIRTREEYKKFIDSIPKFEIGMGDMPRSNDPLLQEPMIDFNRYMMVVVVNIKPTLYSGPKGVSIQKVKNNVIVYFRINRKQDLHAMQWPYGHGYYAAKVIPRQNEQIIF